jgi:hypothetical protein
MRKWNRCLPHSRDTTHSLRDRTDLQRLCEQAACFGGLSIDLVEAASLDTSAKALRSVPFDVFETRPVALRRREEQWLPVVARQTT